MTGRGSAPSYLFGTCHLGVSLDQALPASARGALTNARTVVLEADLGAVDTAQVARRLLMPPGESLRAMLGEQHWQRLVRQPGLATAPWLLLDRFEPWVIAMMLMARAIQQTSPRGAAPARAMDLVIQSQATAAHARLVYLETADEQLQLIAAMPRASGVEAVRSALGGARPLRAMLGSVLEVCRSGDTRAFDAWQASASRAEGFDALVDARTRAWVPRVRALVEEGGAFVAVGAAHVLGPRGLVGLLRAEGLTIEQVTVPSPAGDIDAGISPTTEDGSSAESATPMDAAGPEDATEPVASDAGRNAPDASEPQGVPFETWVQIASELVARRGCEPSGFARQCFNIDEARCLETARRAVRLCVDQLGITQDDVRPGTTEGLARVTQCAEGSYHALYRVEGLTRNEPRCASVAAFEESQRAAQPAQPTQPATTTPRRSRPQTR